MKEYIRALRSHISTGNFLRPGLYIGIAGLLEATLFLGLSVLLIKSWTICISLFALFVLSIFLRGPATLFAVANSLVWGAFGFYFLFSTLPQIISLSSYFDETRALYTSIPFSLALGSGCFLLALIIHFHDEPVGSPYAESSEGDYDDYFEEKFYEEMKWRKVYEESQQQNSTSNNQRAKNTDTIDPHEILGIAPGSTPDQIKAAYRKQMKQYHPDNFHNFSEDFRKLANEKAAAIKEAYEKLCA